MTRHAELSVSNISWLSDRDELAYDVLSETNVKYIDIAPSKIFPSIQNRGIEHIDRREVQDFMKAIGKRGLKVAGFQSLAYGLTGNFITSSQSAIRELSMHIADVIHLAEEVGAHTLVYGAGSSRKYEGLDPYAVNERAADFFTPLDTVARESGVVLGIEPVSTTWTNGMPVFGRTANEIIDFTSALKREGATNTKLVIDTFAMHDADEDPSLVVDRAVSLDVLAPHMQISEPKMAPHSEKSPIDHEAFSSAMRAITEELAVKYPATIPTIAIEMFASAASESEAMQQLTNSIHVAQKSYSSAIME
jgi:D-psicose/D-tagatose/L-ribulose 3-epimerase